MSTHEWLEIARALHAIMDELGWVHVVFVVVILLPFVTVALVRLLRPHGVGLE